MWSNQRCCAVAPAHQESPGPGAQINQDRKAEDIKLADGMSRESADPEWPRPASPSSAARGLPLFGLALTTTSMSPMNQMGTRSRLLEFGFQYGGRMKYLDVDGIGKVSRIGLGTWQFGSREWGYGDSYASGAARDIVQRALALGVTLFDTAEIYAMGKSERILGEALGDQRSAVALASKIFPIAPFPPVIKQRERASARRLQVDRIPLYQIHQPNPVVPDSVIMPGMRSLLDSGDIGAAGVSNYSLARWQKADAALGRPVISNQVQFSLARPRALDDLVPFAERENRIVIAYSPLAQGLLGAKYGLDNRPGGVRAANQLFGTENLRRVEPLLQTLRDIATEVGAKPAQVALAWLISLPNVVAIPGASSVEQLEFNVAAADIELSPQSRDALTDAARAFRPVSTSRFLIDRVREKLGRA